jgi:hypothetical protein
VDVVLHPTDFDGLHFVLPGDAAQKRPEPVAQFRSDELPSFLGAENTMKIGADGGHGIHSAVPSELMQFRIFPALKRRAIIFCPCGTDDCLPTDPALKCRAVFDGSFETEHLRKN